MKNNHSLGVQVVETFKMMGRKIGRELRNSGLDLPVEQFLLLSILYSKEDVIQQDLAQMLKKDKSGILRILDSLQRKEMIRRVADPEDRRRKHLVLTEKGMETIRQAINVEVQVVCLFLEGIADEDLLKFSGILKTIRTNCEKDFLCKIS